MESVFRLSGRAAAGRGEVKSRGGGGPRCPPGPPTRGEPQLGHGAAGTRARRPRAPSGPQPRAGPAPATAELCPRAAANAERRAGLGCAGVGDLAAPSCYGARTMGAQAAGGSGPARGARGQGGPAPLRGGQHPGSPVRPHLDPGGRRRQDWGTTRAPTPARPPRRALQSRVPLRRRTSRGPGTVVAVAQASSPKTRPSRTVQDV